MERKGNIERWIKGIPCEITFWNNVYIHKKWRDWFLHGYRLGHDINLHNFDAKSFLKNLDSHKKNIVIDLGCGLSYMTGNMIDGTPIDIQYVDPLADYYNDIIKRTKVKAPLIKFGMMEYISSFYNKDEVALIIIQNALDHSENPIKGIIESLRCLRIGGILYLKHYPNEAEKESYRGFHQFNIDIDNGKMIIWNKTEKYVLDDIVGTFTEISISRYTKRNEVIAVIKKNKEVPSELIDDKTDIRNLSHQLLIQSRLTDSLSFVINYHLTKLMYICIRYLIQGFSPQIKEGLRKLYGKIKS